VLHTPCSSLCYWQVANLETKAQDRDAVIRVKREALEDSKQCGVCLERDVNVALAGCGHTFCRECVAGLAVCPLCRTAVTGVNPVFF
jgi:hypothetical protein